MTHGPPLGFGDRVASGRTGCADLLLAIQERIRPSFHVFGHIHEGYGAETDGSTVFINASICTEDYDPVNRPIVFDVLPKTRSPAAAAAVAARGDARGGGGVGGGAGGGDEE